MVDTVLGGIVHMEQNSSGKYLLFNNGADTLDAMAGMGIRGNRIVNSGLFSWQEGTSFTSIATTTFFADLFEWISAGAGVADVARSTDTPSVDAPYSALVTVTTADAAVAATDEQAFRYQIEGQDIRDARMGTAGARTLFLTFDVKCSVTGTFCVALVNSALDRSYVAEYEVLAANTWETKTVEVPGDTAGTWLYGEAEVGLRVWWTLMAGTNFQGTADTWNAALDIASASQTNLFATISNTWRMANPRLYVGSIPSSASGAPVGERERVLELERIKRHFERVDLSAVSGASYGAGMCTSTTAAIVPIGYRPKLQIPTVTPSAAADFDVLDNAGSVVAVTGLTAGQITPVGARMAVTVAAGLAGGDATLLLDDGTAASYIDVDARLA